MITLENKKFRLCEAILMQDAKVWKEVRKAWFNVVVEGIMKDYETKKTLAQVLDMKMTFSCLQASLCSNFESWFE